MKPILVFLIVCLVFSVFLGEIRPCSATSYTETRYMRSDTANVNGLTCYKLLTTNTAIPDVFTAEKASGSAVQIKWGFRAYKRTSGSVETELTASASDPVIICTLGTTTSAETEYNVNWTCSSTALASTDSVVVYPFQKVGTNAWSAKGYMSPFQTAQLGASNLDANSWMITIHADYYNWGSPYGCSSTLWFGSSAHDSRIAGFKWTLASGQSISAYGSAILTFAVSTRKSVQFSRQGNSPLTFVTYGAYRGFQGIVNLFGSAILSFSENVVKAFSFNAPGSSTLGFTVNSLKATVFDKEATAAINFVVSTLRTQTLSRWGSAFLDFASNILKQIGFRIDGYAILHMIGQSSNPFSIPSSPEPHSISQPFTNFPWLNFYVVDASNNPVQNFLISVYSQPGGELVGTFISQENGYGVQRQMETGEYSFKAEGPGLTTEGNFTHTQDETVRIALGNSGSAGLNFWPSILKVVIAVSVILAAVFAVSKVKSGKGW